MELTTKQQAADDMYEALKETQDILLVLCKAFLETSQSIIVQEQIKINAKAIAKAKGRVIMNTKDCSIFPDCVGNNLAGCQLKDNICSCGFPFNTEEEYKHHRKVGHAEGRI